MVVLCKCRKLQLVLTNDVTIKNVSYTVFNFLYVVVANSIVMYINRKISAVRHLNDTFIFISCNINLNIPVYRKIMGILF